LPAVGQCAIKRSAVTKPSLSLVQSIVGVTAGLISIVGAAFSAVQLFKPGPHYGEVVAIVREARSEKPVTDATVEIFTRDDALVTTLTSVDTGQIRQPLKEGTYRLRISHPRFAAETRSVQVTTGQTAQVRVQLTQRVGGSTPIGAATHAVNEGVGAVHRLMRGLGL
jgi:Carboxypeptidase regulatory-like domain